jgi:hypothetical protein
MVAAILKTYKDNASELLLIKCLNLVGRNACEDAISTGWVIWRRMITAGTDPQVRPRKTTKHLTEGTVHGQKDARNSFDSTALRVVGAAGLWRD